jgi:zinc transporter ZupT
MLPSRWAFLLAFGGVVLAGVLGGIIGYGIADVSSPSDVSHIIGAFVGAVIGAGGVGIVAVLVLRAMAEWRRQDPSSPRPPRRPS